MTQTFKQCTLSEKAPQSIHLTFSGGWGRRARKGLESLRIWLGAPFRAWKQSGSAFIVLGLCLSGRTVMRKFKGPGLPQTPLEE